MAVEVLTLYKRDFHGVSGAVLCSAIETTPAWASLRSPRGRWEQRGQRGSQKRLPPGDTVWNWKMRGATSDAG